MNGDRFSSLTALEERLGAGVFRVHCFDRNSHVTVIAPHGGFIEAGTSALAASIAARKHNLFDFRGLLKKNSFDLHVTSTRFRHPCLSALLKKSEYAVSIHGMGDQGHSSIWLGGLNLRLKEITLLSLLKEGFEVNPDSPLYRGENRKNVVNLARLCGVQLELSNELLRQLFQGRRFYVDGRKPQSTLKYRQLVRAVRSAIATYEAELRDPKRDKAS